MKKRVILVGLNTGQENYEYTMKELENLAVANDYEVLDIIGQNLEKSNRSTHIGKGKVEELNTLNELLQADAFVFNDELTPSEIKNLEEALGCEVIDRTALILTIFADRAKTREAKLQVEMARLKYELPRIAAHDVTLDQQRGGAGFSNRGAGEKKIERDRRLIKNKIQRLTKELEEIARSREVRRRKRKKNEIPVVSLVGYTNAGKSTIMNGLVSLFSEQPDKKKVLEKDMLFATLETSIRAISLPDKKQFLLTDTVGFVSKLPTHLIKAFRSTLEEAKEADLLLHVVDYSDPNHEKMREVTEKTLADVDVAGIPTLYLYNKADQMKSVAYPELENNRLVFSARDKKSLGRLAELIQQHLFNEYVEAYFLIPFNEGEWVDYLNQQSIVKETEYLGTGTKIKAEISPTDLEKLSRFLVMRK